MIRRRKSRRFSGLSKFIIFFLIILFISTIFFVFRSNFFQIKQIEVKSEQLKCVDVEQLKNEFGLYGQNIIFLNSKKIIEGLKGKFICVKDINLMRVLPDKVQITLNSRIPFAVLLSLKDQQASASSLIENIATPEASEVQDSFLVDSENMVFSKETESLNIPKIYISDSDISLGKNLDNSSVKNSLQILERIRTFGVTVKKSWISQDFFIVNPDTLDPKIIFRLDGEIDSQLASLQLILTEAKIDLKELEFIDLRFDKPVVRFAPKNHG